MTPEETDPPASADQPKHSDPAPSTEESSPSDDAPVTEDGYTLEPSGEQEVAEDDPDLLDPSTRSLETAQVDAEDDGAETPSAAAEVIETDDAGDADGIPDEPAVAEVPPEPLADARLGHDVVAHRIAVQLKHVEVEVRELLEGRDSKRKRKLSGTRRWHDLEEDIIAWRYSGRFDEASLIKLTGLVARRHYLFRSLRFAAGARPRWNT